MVFSEMTVVERLLFLELAVEELRRELLLLEGRLGSKSVPRLEDAAPSSAVPEEHQDLEVMLNQQRATLSKILDQASVEMEKLKRGLP